MKIKRMSKSERIIYIVIMLWIIFGIMGIVFKTNLPELAGYYVSLTLFVSTYIWGEYKRTSTSTSLFKKGMSSTREIVIFITVFLWTVLGLYGILKNVNINDLTVYFTALTPFVGSYIIYKTNKGNDIPILKKEENVDTIMNNH
jgi:predicted neutral ceramidase superfamily lipid hydrolase